MDLTVTVIFFIFFFMSIVAHEVAHGWAAFKLGDPTASLLGRLTFNPLKHVDPFMSLIVPVVIYISSRGQFTFGGAKPVPINPFNFRNPDRGMMLTALAGPLTNILIGLFFSMMLMITAHTVHGPMTENVPFMVFLKVAHINFFLAFFNLIPIPPLDGSRVLRFFMPADIKAGMDRMERFGMIVLVIFLMTPLGRPVFDLFHYIIFGFFQMILPGPPGM